MRSPHGWWSNFLTWYGRFLAVPGAYVALASVAHVVYVGHPSGQALGPQVASSARGAG